MTTKKDMPNVLIPDQFNHPKILVVASYMLAIENFGTACHFNLLPIPWSDEEFILAITDMINHELHQYEMLLSQPEETIFDIDREIISRGLGLRFWTVAEPDKSDLLFKLHSKNKITTDESSTKLAFNFIDSLSLTNPNYEYRFDDIPENINENLIKLESFLFRHLYNDL